ncbi:MAG: helix-turn-helix domain-containing protein [Butyrivibrio sp.]|nr:helix-turn-helix domain-containing protein [Butyrivibrio sp.]
MLFSLKASELSRFQTSVATHFNYHPNYISSLLHRETGRKFTEILLEKRMERAVLLMKHTTLSIEEISSMLGYSNHSNFYIRKGIINTFSGICHAYFAHSGSVNKADCISGYQVLP